MFSGSVCWFRTSSAACQNRRASTASECSESISNPHPTDTDESDKKPPSWSLSLLCSSSSSSIIRCLPGTFDSTSLSSSSNSKVSNNANEFTRCHTKAMLMMNQSGRWEGRKEGKKVRGGSDGKWMRRCWCWCCCCYRVVVVVVVVVVAVVLLSGCLLVVVVLFAFGILSPSENVLVDGCLLADGNSEVLGLYQWRKALDLFCIQILSIVSSHLSKAVLKRL